MPYTRTLLTVVTLMVATISTQAQDPYQATAASYKSDKPTEILTRIDESDYHKFLDLHNLNKYANIRYKGISRTSPDLKKFYLEMNGKGISVEALYDRDGSLLRGRLVKTDTPLPNFIYDYLAIDQLKGWQMTANKTVVTNFNPKTTEYMVKLNKNGKKRTLFFNYFGARIDRLTESVSLSPKSLSLTYRN